MSASKSILIAALAKNGYTMDDVGQWLEPRPGVFRVLVRTHRVVWYTVTADGRMSPM